MGTFNEAQLVEILHMHQVWLETGGAEGERADLSTSDLGGVDLSYTNLSGANLSYTNLSGANLSYANLSGANLIVAYLDGADLSGANICGADFERAQGDIVKDILNKQKQMRMLADI